ncbi:MAG: HEAT repeat domain-containing protein, partial [Leptonema sp. (in: Bacteria)]|nr:HEAT repeat domain-containing protein [Leptonema sp. (in: bacteria)]
VLPLLTSKRSETRFFAAEIAGQLPGPNTGKQLLSLFNENQPISSAPAAIALGYMKYEPARPAIEQRLLNKKSGDREILAKSLGWIGNQESVKLLIEVLNENDGEGRYGAAWSLGILGAKEALPDLEKAVNSSDSKLASLAIEAIGGIGSPSSLKVLLKPARQSGLQVYAIDAIGQIQGQEALEALQKLGVDGNEKTAALAVQALANRHDPNSASALIAILRKTSTESPIAGQIYKALYQRTGERFTSKTQWLQWYEAKHQN